MRIGPSALKNAWQRTSLRLRLAAGLVVITAVVLIGSGFAVLHALHGFLLQRLDQQVTQFSDQLPRALLLRPGPGVSSRVGPLPTGALALVIAPDGTQLAEVSAPPGGTAPPTVPDSELQRLTAVGAGSNGAPQTIRIAGITYRATISSGPGGSTVVAALPLKPVNDTLHRLVLIEVLVGLGAITLAGTAGALMVRLSLRPLNRISSSARGIMNSNLSRSDTAVELRVPDAPPTTEVGQLSSALNAMLQHIEEGFEARTLAEQRLRQFIADASHELRTPLSSIRGYAELFRRGGAAHPDDVAVAMRRIEEEGEQMSVLIDDLLLLARLDQGRPLEQEPVDLAALCADAAADSRVIDSGWPVILDVPAEPLVVTGDQLRLRQVLGNLVRNARVHTPPGTTITISVQCLDLERMALLTVSDDGPGIAPEALPHVFDRFYRADASRSRSSGGSGLGLSIVQAIVQSHGGRVDLTSAPGATTVEVRLPMMESPNGLPSQEVHSGSSGVLQHPEQP